MILASFQNWTKSPKIIFFPCARSTALSFYDKHFKFSENLKDRVPLVQSLRIQGVHYQIIIAKQELSNLITIHFVFYSFNYLLVCHNNDLNNLFYSMKTYRIYVKNKLTLKMY